MSLYSSGIAALEGTGYDWRGDFLGFTIGGIHSSNLGIVRISDSDRYSEELVPTFNDKTATVPGLDKTYYFGREYTQKSFTIKFAFDNLTEKQLHQLRRIFSEKEPQDLIFDEAPYKIYSVVVNGQPQISYVCFDENLSRIYKGDGTVNFTTYFPFARSRFKYKENYVIKNIEEWGGEYDNRTDWLESSGIIYQRNPLNPTYIIDKIIKSTNYWYAFLYNAGDVPTYPIITFQFDRSSITDENKTVCFKIFANDVEEPEGQMELDLSLINDETVIGLKIDCEKRLIFGLDSNGDTNVIWNNIIKSGNFFPILASPISTSKNYLNFRIDTDVTISNSTIDYDYLYY